MSPERGKRLNVRGPVRFRAALAGTLLPEKGPPSPLMTLDICAGGMLARIPGPLAPQSHVALQLQVGKETFATQALCLRATESSPCEAAFFFLDPDPRLKVHLFDYLNERYESYV